MVTAKIELLLNMIWIVVYCVQLPVCWIFCFPWLFQSFCLSQSIPVTDFQYWSCKSWVSVLVLDIKVLVLVLVLVLDKQVLNPSLISRAYKSSLQGHWVKVKVIESLKIENHYSCSGKTLIAHHCGSMNHKSHEVFHVAWGFGYDVVWRDHHFCRVTQSDHASVHALICGWSW